MSVSRSKRSIQLLVRLATLNMSRYFQNWSCLNSTQHLGGSFGPVGSRHYFSALVDEETVGAQGEKVWRRWQHLLLACRRHVVVWITSVFVALSRSSVGSYGMWILGPTMLVLTLCDLALVERSISTKRTNSIQHIHFSFSGAHWRTMKLPIQRILPEICLETRISVCEKYNFKSNKLT